MTFPVFLAHGALGVFDELIFVGVALAFIAMMGISWLRSRNESDDEAEPVAPIAMPPTDDIEPPERFKLE